MNYIATLTSTRCRLIWKEYFGEMTFFDGSGFDEFHPEEWDKKFGDMIKLPEQVGGVRSNS